MTVSSPIGRFTGGAFLCLIIYFLCSTPAAYSEPYATPTQTHDLNPLTIVYGLPLATAPSLINADTMALSASLNISNTINVENPGNENLFIDGETTQLNLIVDYGINEVQQLRLRIPFIRHGAGSLDGFIDDFHDFFGFPQGHRPNYANNQFSFLYQVNSVDLIHIDQANQGIGDISLDSGYQIRRDQWGASSIWASLKLPTGDAEQLNGSGAADLALWWASERSFAHDWHRYLNLGVLLLGHGEVLANQQRSKVLFGTAGLQWRVIPVLSLNVQLDFHSAFYDDTSLEFLGDSIQISSGGHIRLSHDSRLEIAVIEDIQVGASPDVTFHFTWVSQF